MNNFSKDTEERLTNENGASKGQKSARFDLIPIEPLWKLAELYGVGARKYDERNWEKGYKWSLSYAALQRHANQFWSGEDYDEETDVPHMINVIFHAMVLVEYMSTHPELDDRPKPKKSNSFEITNGIGQTIVKNAV